jgi:hypothetical protein
MKKKESGVSLAMIMLEKIALRSTKTFRESLQRAFPGESVAVVPSADEKKGTYVFKLGEYDLYVALMPGPIPWTELETLTQAAWHWQESGELLRGHKAHILVTIMNPPTDPLDADLLMTRVVTALLEVQEALGVYWPGPAITSRKMFMELGRDASRDAMVPVLLWVSFSPLREKNGEISVITQGMERLGHKEMELMADAGNEDCIEFSLDLAMYVLKAGPVLKPGQTFGRTAQEKFPISQRPWRFDESRTAIILDMRSGGQKKGFYSRLLGK